MEGDTIKVSQKKTEDVEEGSSSRKKQKRKEDEEIKAEFGPVIEKLWRRVVRKWEELERRQEQRWAAISATLGHIMDNVQELLDRLVPEEKEKGLKWKWKEWRWRKWRRQRSRGRRVRGQRKTETETWRSRRP